MSSLAISGVVLACIGAGAALGMILRAILSEKQLSRETKGVIKLGTGLVGSMTALVLGLLTASAKSSYDTQRSGLAQVSGNVVVLDRALARYGEESKDAREVLRDSVADMIRRTWPGESAEPEQSRQRSGTEGRYEGLYEKILELTPKNDRQRAFQAQALKAAMDIGEARWLLFAQQGGSIPVPFLVILVFWLALLFGSFNLLTRPNATGLVALLLCALSVVAAIFLILELDQPFEGVLRLSSEPMRRALERLGN